MINLRDNDSKSLLGSISEEDLQFLIDNLEEEWEGDTDYYLNRTVIDTLAEAGGDKALIELLNKALGDRDGVEIVWEKP